MSAEYAFLDPVENKISLPKVVNVIAFNSKPKEHVFPETS